MKKEPIRIEDYRQRLYRSYVSTHLSSSIGDISIEAFDKQRVAFRKYFGRLLPKDKNAPILDIGCGSGGFLYFLRKEGYKNAFGVDISPEQVEIARKLGIANVRCGDLKEFLEEHPRQFMAVTALNVVEHFGREEVLLLLDAVYNVLKPEGVFIILSPNAEGPFGSRIFYSDFTHYTAFTKTSIRQLLTAAGFKDIEVHPVEPVIHGILSASRWLLWQVIRLLLQLYLAAETGCFGDHILTQNLIAVARKPTEAGRSL